MKQIVLLISLIGIASACSAMDKTPEGKSRDIHALAQGPVDILPSVLKKLGDINARDHAGLSALHWASLQGRYNVVEFLLEKGANPDVRGAYCRTTPLHGAVEVGFLSLIALLLEHDAWIDAQNKDEGTPLHYAVSHNGVTYKLYGPAQFLVVMGADIFIKDEEGFTPLHQAACDGNEKACEALLKALIMRTLWEQSEESLQRIRTSLLVLDEKKKEFNISMPNEVKLSILTGNNELAWDVVCGAGCLGILPMDNFETFKKNIKERIAGIVPLERFVDLICTYAGPEMIKYLEECTYLELIEGEHDSKTASDLAEENEHEELKEFLNAEVFKKQMAEIVRGWLK